MSDSPKMIKTSIDLTREQLAHLKQKAFEQQANGEEASFVSIIRNWIEQDMKKTKKKNKRNVL